MVSIHIDATLDSDNLDEVQSAIDNAEAHLSALETRSATLRNQGLDVDFTTSADGELHLRVGNTNANAQADTDTTSE